MNICRTTKIKSVSPTVGYIIYIVIYQAKPLLYTIKIGLPRSGGCQSGAAKPGAAKLGPTLWDKMGRAAEI
jgi:hypothetical protein